MSTHTPMQSHGHASAHAAAIEAGYEKADPRAKPIVIFTVFLVLSLLLTFYGMKWANDAYMAAETAKDALVHPLAAAKGEPPAPRLQARPNAEWATFESEQAAAVSTYRWIDRSNGVVQLPVERALEILSERGLPHRK